MTRGLRDSAVSDLYNELQPQLVRILVSNLQPPQWVIDDACQTAWSSLLERRDRVEPGGELGWLSTTATRAALRLLRRDRMADAWGRPPVPISLADFRLREPAPEYQFELRERLAEVRRLPVRQQRLVMLHGFGYEYDEIAAVTGQTRRTVARQLTRARQRLLRPVDEA
ncbi:MAG TPA: sigma-70 family RNA polymerase sigma factor [Solirubrobacteraceae bacterium]|nr:sigma-70 family RNA polymerase sigma factor [Solirubrobacteraceae bacterium]